MTLPHFPEDFIFGVATSDSQSEAFVPEFEDIRDLWYKEHRQQQRERATDLWARYKEDVSLAQGLGCKMFRFSVAWSRLEPEDGKFNIDALNHYSQVVDAIRAAGMEPMVTLHHFVWPIHLEKRGGMIADDFPSTYARYAECVAKHFGDRVKYWVTFNEPNILLFGYTKAWWERNYFAPPGLPPEAGSNQQMAAQTKLISNLFLAHTAARRVIKAMQPSALVGVNASVLGLPVWLQNFFDRNVLKLRTKHDVERASRSFSERKFLEHGKIDVLVATFTKTNERASQLDFGEVYFVAHARLLVRADTPYQTVGDLSGKPVAVVETSTAEQQFSTMMPQAAPVPVANHDEGFKKLESGRVSAFLADDVRLLPAVIASPGRYRFLDGNLSDEPYAPATTKGNPLLLDEVDKAVGEFISSGQWAESYRANIGGPVADPPRYPKLANLASLSGIMQNLNAAASGSPPPDQLHLVKARGRIRIGVKSDVPGMGYLDPTNGHWSGMEIDIARAITRRIFGNEQALVLVPLATTKRIPSLRSIFRFLDPVLRVWALITTSVNTNWWQLGMAGKLSSFLCPPECVGQLDYVGLDYYWGISSISINRLFGLLDALTAGRTENAPVYPEGLYNWLKEYSRLFPKLPILLIENGCVSVADNVDRATYLSLHLKQVQRAISDGVNIVAYICWSITSNRELGHRFAPDTDFGLYHIDLDTDPSLVRHRTPSAEVYANIIANRKVPD